jgi:choloylglycine hydrolase
MNKIGIIILGILLSIFSVGYACTSSLIPTQEGGFIYLRSLQFAMPFNSSVIAIPRNYQFAGITPDKTYSGIQWKSKYAVIGANALGMDLILDGINESGLAGGIQYFPGYASYQLANTQGDLAKSLASYQLLTWILTNFASVDEVSNAINNVIVTNAPVPSLNVSFPLHYVVHDNNGKSIVIEYDSRGLKVYKNPLHAFSNSPAFDYHLTNFNQYIGFNNGAGDSFVIDGEKFGPLSAGWNSIGLPGGNDSISRFVRMAFITLSVSTADSMPKNQTEGVLTAFKILNTFDFPYGVAKNNVSIPTSAIASYDYDINEWVSVADLKNRVYYIRTYSDSAIKMLSFKNFNLVSKTITYYPLESQEKFYQLTAAQPRKNLISGKNFK